MRPPQIVVEGKVTTKSGTPLAGAKVASGFPGSAGRSTTTAADGSFRISIPKGQTIFAEYPGYVIGSKPQVMGTETQNIDFQLAVAGSISGKVVDSDGQSLAGITLGLLCKTGDGKIMPLSTDFPAGLQSTTTENGAFRLDGIPPGKYFLLALPSAGAHLPLAFQLMETVPTLRQDSNRVALPGFYPGGVKFTDAQPVAVIEGQNVQELVFRMRTARPYRIQGRIEPPSGSQVYNPKVTVSPAAIGVDLGGTQMGIGYGRTVSGFFSSFGKRQNFPPRDTFDLLLLPGSYRLQASFTDNPDPNANYQIAEKIIQLGQNPDDYRPFSAEFPLEVTDRDIQGLVLSFRNLPRIEGTIRLPGLTSNNPSSSRISVTLAPVDQKSTGTRLPVDYGQTHGEGSLLFPFINPGRYTVAVDLQYQKIAVESVRYNGQPAQNNEFEVLQGENGKLEIVAPYTFGDVSVDLHAGEIQPPAMVTLYLSNEPSSERAYIQMTTVDRKNFRAETVPPGDYIVRISINRPGQPVQSDLGRITVHPNEHLKLDLKFPVQ